MEPNHEIRRTEKLYDEKQLIDNKIEVLELQEEATKSTDMLKLIGGTTWEIDRYGSEISFVSPKKDGDFQGFVYNYLSLWPHGSIQLNENLRLHCNDGDISIKVELCNQVTNKLNNYDHNAYTNASRTSLFAFMKKYDLHISFASLEKSINEHLKMIEKDKEAIKEMKTLYVLVDFSD